MHVAIIMLIVALGSVLFHLISPWWSTPIASNWGYIDDTITITFWITGVAFVAVIGFMAYCIYKFGNKPGQVADYEPENSRLEWALTIITTLGVIGMLAPGLVVWNDYVVVPEDADEVEVVGTQWQWAYRYPGKDGKLGITAVKYVSGDNPFGIYPGDPNGQDDVVIEGDDLHLPRGKSVKFLLRSLDVLHDFYVPQFRAKMDMVPGMVTYFWVRPTRNGTFDALCAELCGVGHHAMRGKVVVEDQAAYDAWIAEQQTFSQSQAAIEKRKRNTDFASRKGATKTE